jgi:hypothetical protein
MRRLFLITWVIIAFNGAVIAGQGSREPLGFMLTVVRFLVVHPGRVSLADLQRNSGRAGKDLIIYGRLYGTAALQRLSQYNAEHRLHGCLPDPTDPRLQEIQDAQASANDPRFKNALPALGMLWGGWALICVVGHTHLLRLRRNQPSHS